jgi:hypothetical protein
MLKRLNFHSSCLLPVDSSGWIARELWWTSQESSSSPWRSMLTYHPGMNNRPVRGRGTESQVSPHRYNQSISYPQDNKASNPTQNWHKQRWKFLTISFNATDPVSSPVCTHLSTLERTVSVCLCCYVSRVLTKAESCLSRVLEVTTLKVIHFFHNFL